MTAGGPPAPLGSESVLLVRHGETLHNREPARFQGQRDTPLADTGREQARRLGASLAGAGIAALHASALSRAHETARVVGAALELEPRPDARLNEAAMGSWEGRAKDAIEREEPELWAAWRRAGPDFRFPGGESLAELQARVLAALEEVRAGPVPALVVCHGGPIRAALAAASPRGLFAYHELDPANTEVVPLPPEALLSPRA